MLDVAEIKVIRAIFDLFNGRGSHFINGDRRFEIHALVVELKLERRLDIVPVGFVVIELNLLVVRVFHIAKNGG